MASTNDVEMLLGANVEHDDYYSAAHTGGPHTEPAEEDIDRIKLSYNILIENQAVLLEAVDGDINADALIVANQSEEEKPVKRGVYRRVHDYVSALYSYIEQVIAFINNHTNSSHEIDSRDISPWDGDDAPCDFVQQLAYPLGIRHGFQHGAYHFLDFNKKDEYRGFAFHTLRFLQNEFENSSVENAESYTQYLTHVPLDANHPLKYFDQFHRNSLQSFHNNLLEWTGDNS